MNARLLVPPILIDLKRKFFPKKEVKDQLFDGDDSVFKKHLATAKCYLEYGVGKSTIWVYNNTKAKIVAIDSSRDWINKVQTALKLSDRINFKWVDLGKLAEWGKPVNYSNRSNFMKYVTAVWEDRKFEAEIILIDGRFRVSCFLYSLAMASPGTKIFFDDYVNRPKYHLVEEFVKPVEICGRQALFIVPDHLNKEQLSEESVKFTYVID